MGERYVRNVQVGGSSPPISTSNLFDIITKRISFQPQILSSKSLHKPGFDRGAFSSKSPSFLVRNQSSYCFRIAVPKDIREVVGKTELRYSLQTGSLGEVRYRSRRLAESVQRLFRELRQETDKMAQLSWEKFVSNLEIVMPNTA